MDYWHSKSLGDGMWADIPSEEIKRLFQPLFESAGRPAGMAVFTRHEEGGCALRVDRVFFTRSGGSCGSGRSPPMRKARARRIGSAGGK